MKTLEQLETELKEARSHREVVGEKYKDLPMWKRHNQRDFRLAGNRVFSLMEAIEKFHLNVRRKNSGILEVEKILRKEFGLKKSRNLTTSVRGWHNQSHGYLLRGDDTIEFIGFPPLKEIVERLSPKFNLEVSGLKTTPKNTTSSIRILNKNVT